MQNPNNQPSASTKSSAAQDFWFKRAHKRVRGFLRRMVFDTWENMPGLFKVLGTLILLSMLIFWAGFAWDGRNGLLLAFILVLLLNSIVFFYATRLSDIFPGTEWVGQDPWGLQSDLKVLCYEMKLAKPTLYIINLATPLIYSCGLTQSAVRLVVSDGFLARLSRQERRALIIFELVRIKTHLTSTATGASALASCFQWLGSLLDVSIFFPVFFLTKTRIRHGRIEPVRLGLALVAPMVGAIIRLTVPRHRILKCDGLAIEQLMKFGLGPTEARRLLAESLFKLDAYLQTRPVPIRLCDTAHFAVNPLTEHDVSPIFFVHPPIERRLSHLIGRPTL